MCKVLSHFISQKKKKNLEFSAYGLFLSRCGIHCVLSKAQPVEGEPDVSVCAWLFSCPLSPPVVNTGYCSLRQNSILFIFLPTQKNTPPTHGLPPLLLPSLITPPPIPIPSSKETAGRGPHNTSRAHWNIPALKSPSQIFSAERWVV